MILTLTANPSVDHTVRLGGKLARGSVIRAEASASQAGGKGVNISRAAIGAGVPTLAIVPAPEGDPFVAELATDGIPCHPVGPASSPRGNITITEPDGTTTKLNLPGPTASPALLEELAATVESHARDASWIVLAGSLPPGAPEEWYASLLARLARLDGVRTAVDTSEGPLAAVVASLDQAAPALLKPNAEELAVATGTAPGHDPAAAALAARALLDRGLGACLVTLGGDGAVLVTPDGAWHADPPPTTVVSTVGAGDSSLFGYLLADLRGLPAPERLRLAVAYGSAAAGLPGTCIPTPTQVRPDQVVVRALETGGH